MLCTKNCARLYKTTKNAGGKTADRNRTQKNFVYVPVYNGFVVHYLRRRGCVRQMYGSLVMLGACKQYIVFCGIAIDRRSGFKSFNSGMIVVMAFFTTC